MRELAQQDICNCQVVCALVEFGRSVGRFSHLLKASLFYSGIETRSLLSLLLYHEHDTLYQICQVYIHLLMFVFLGGTLDCKALLAAQSLPGITTNNHGVYDDLHYMPRLFFLFLYLGYLFICLFYLHPYAFFFFSFFPFFFKILFLFRLPFFPRFFSFSFLVSHSFRSCFDFCSIILRLFFRFFSPFFPQLLFVLFFCGPFFLYMYFVHRGSFVHAYIWTCFF